MSAATSLASAQNRSFQRAMCRKRTAMISQGSPHGTNATHSTNEPVMASQARQLQAYLPSCGRFAARPHRTAPHGRILSSLQGTNAMNRYANAKLLVPIDFSEEADGAL